VHASFIDKNKSKVTYIPDIRNKVKNNDLDILHLCFLSNIEMNDRDFV
jgi:hypothetical protein